GGRCQCRSAAPAGRRDALAGVLVASFHRSGSPGRGEHRRDAARHRLLNGRANIPGRGRPVSFDLLVRPEACFAASIFVDRGAQERATCSPDDPPGCRVRDLPGGPRTEPPWAQPAPGLETVATPCRSPLTLPRSEQRPPAVTGVGRPS